MTIGLYIVLFLCVLYCILIKHTYEVLQLLDSLLLQLLFQLVLAKKSLMVHTIKSIMYR